MNKVAVTVTIILLIVSNFEMGTTGKAQSRFETSPYRVRIVLTTDGSAIWTKARLDDLKSKLSERIGNGFGKLLSFEIDTDSVELLRDSDLSLLTKSLAANLVKASEQFRVEQLEKVIYLQLQQNTANFKICSVEHDLQNQYIGSPAELACKSLEDVAYNLPLVVAGAFGGNARLTGATDGNITIRPRASLVPARDPALAVCPEGAVLQLLPIGQQKIAGVESRSAADATTDHAVWRFLVVQKADPLASECKLVSRFNEETEIPIDKFVGREIHPIHNSTTIQFLNSEDKTPLVGLEVEILDQHGQSVSNSKSDINGRIVVSKTGKGSASATSSLVELVVGCHGQPLLQIPVVIGWQRRINCPLELTRQRLDGLAAIQVHRSQLNNWIAHREVILARATALTATNKAAADQVLIDLKEEADSKRSSLEAKIRGDKTRFSLDQNHWNQLTVDVAKEMKVD